MPIPAESIMQFTWKLRTFGQILRHVRCWRLQTGGAGAGQIEHANAFIQALKIGGPAPWTASYLDCLSSDNNLLEYRAQVISPVRGAYAYLEVPVATFGSRGIAITGNIQASIEASTRFGGRNQVACYKLGTLATDDCQNGHVRPALLTNLMAYSATFKLPVTLAGATPSVWVPCIFHRAKKPAIGTYDDIYDSGARDEIRAKNTRTIGRGE